MDEFTQCMETSTRSLEILKLPIQGPCILFQHIEHLNGADGELSRCVCGHMSAGSKYCCEYCYRPRDAFSNINSSKVIIFCSK